MDIDTLMTEEARAQQKPSVCDADWTLIFTPAGIGCPSIQDAIPGVEVRKSDICTGKMHGIWAALDNQAMPMIRCEPVSREFLLRIMMFMGTWYRGNFSDMMRPHRPAERERISARRLAAVMREPEHQVAYGLRLLSIDDAVKMTHMNGRTEFSFNKLFI